MRKVCLCLLLVGVCASLYAADAPASLFKWEDVTDHGKGDYARAVTISGTTAVAAELLTAPDNGLDFTIKAFDVVTGQLRWQDSVAAFPGIVTGVFVASSADSVFALGYISGAAVSSSDLFVRAYRVSTGNILWTHYWDAGRDDIPEGISVSNGRVTIVGYGGNVLPGESLHGLVRTLNATTGAVLWTAMADEATWHVSSSNFMVITASGRSVGTRTDLVLRAYNGQNGTPIWQTVRESSGGIVKIDNNRLFVAINEMTASGIKISIAKYDIPTGTLLWQSASLPGRFTSLAVTQSQVVAVGDTGAGLFVESVDPSTGAVKWSSQTAPAPQYHDFLAKVAVTENAVYAVGSSGLDFQYAETMLRVYSPTGALLTDERSHHVLGSRSSGGFDLAVNGQYLAVAGAVSNATSDAVVRAYDVSSIEPKITVGPVDRWSAPIVFEGLMWTGEWQ